MKLTLPIVYLFSLFFLYSCTEKVEPKLDKTEERVVIEGLVSTEADSSYVRISRTASYFSNDEPPAIANATVEVSDGNTVFPLSYKGDGYYFFQPSFRGEAGKTYKLSVSVDGATYSSEAVLYPMFEVDTNIVATYKPAEGFIPEGYAITYMSRDSRPEEIFTWFNFGKNDTLESFRIIFTNSNTLKNQWVPFELPFFRPVAGDTVMMVFKTLGRPQADFFTALDNLNSGAPGPFRTPPANPPSNIRGGALGYFMATEVLRINKKIP